jgi:uncharacterized Zn finger protein (UPF0148 family)
MPSQHIRGQHARQQSLGGYRCPSCKAGLFRLMPGGTNVCDNPKCRYELVTEWEWQRRQQPGYVPGEPKFMAADDLPGSY